MRRSLGARLAAFLLVISMAIPAVAAPRRDDSPIGDFERVIARWVQQVIHIFDLDLNQVNPPK